MRKILFLVAFLLTGCFQPVSGEVDRGADPTETVTTEPTAANTPDPTATPQVVEICGTVNVRPSASEHGAVIRWIDGGTVTVLEWGDGWARIGAREWITQAVLCP
jgi:hypothetical protein